MFPTVAIRVYRSLPLVPLDSCLTAAACLSNACLIADCYLALLVGYVRWRPALSANEICSNCMIIVASIYLQTKQTQFLIVKV